MKHKELKDEDKKMFYTSIHDVCSFLDITWDTWNNYKNKSGYSDIIKKAESRIFNEWIKNLFFPGRNATGAIFYLKNALGWTDKREMQATIKSVQEDPKLADLSDNQLEKLNEAFEALEEKENTIEIESEEN